MNATVFSPHPRPSPREEGNRFMRLPVWRTRYLSLLGRGGDSASPESKLTGGKFGIEDFFCKLRYDAQASHC